ncbi:hypothetical protein BDU57DRAFT_528101 [Ampelomyces quisqualis]|uniref:SET domain-containing protein n=1 Tax=Ampelomyces quisqualis TaxID=50730 RepID=A0A6A5QQ19_AMPQU|nr:hypothetical protein BDU57DRAFT_528101 [Ampelomyces quisqualis]
MSDVSIGSGRAVENEAADHSESSTKLAEKKKSRADRRRVVKGKGKEVMQQQDEEDEADDVQDSASVASSSTLSAGTVATQILDEPYQPGKSSQPRVSTTSPVMDTVPVLPHYEHRQVPDPVGNAFPRHGIFATQDIAAGTRIIYEAPLLAFPSLRSDPTVLMPAFRALNDHEQDMIYKLHPIQYTVTQNLTDMAAMIRQHLPRFCELSNTPAATITQAAKEEFDQLALELSEACETYRVTARWEAHHQVLSPFPSDDPLAAEIDGSALFPGTALLRHSCVPNTHKYFNNATRKLSVHVIQDVAAGQELTSSHLEDNFFNDAATRKFYLQQDFSIICECTACTGSFVGMHDTARLHAYRCRKQALPIVDTLPNVGFSAYGADLRLDEDSQLDRWKVNEALLVQLLGALRTTGCLDPELVRWLYPLFTSVLPRTAQGLADAERICAWKEILLHAQRSVEIVVRCLGRDLEVAGSLAGLVKVIGDKVERAEERMRVLRESRERLGL